LFPLTSEAPASAAFRAEGLCKSFGSRRVIDSLDISIPQGTALGLLGPNGAGKSTLLKLLLGLLEPDAGRALVAGEPAGRLASDTRARIGYVPQSPDQFAWLTGRSMLAYVLSFYPHHDPAYLHSLTERWQVSLDVPIGRLSPGQQQRLAIVRALASAPDLLVLDEPLASLDPAIRMAVIEELQRLRAQAGMTLIIASHIVGDLHRLCSELAILTPERLAIRAPLGWFTGLSCLTLDGPESELAGFNLSAAVHARRSTDGQRVLLIPRTELDAWRQGLPQSLRPGDPDSGLDRIVSEWMQ
jgi:ABC-2 type transport system ATP-binding protein